MAKKIGIWGLGVAGKSIIRYLSAHGLELGVHDKRTITQEEQTFLTENNVRFFPDADRDLFLSSYDVIVPSAGIDLRPYSAYAHKWLSEVDLFASAHHGPLTAITGSLGKTSVTHLLSCVLKNAGKKVATGGNIGVGMLDLIGMEADMTVLELSSFQLEHAKVLAPDLAIMTNIYPNHLDRHGTFEQYAKAKFALIQNQKTHQKSLIHADTFEYLKKFSTQSPTALFSHNRPTDAFDVAYYFDENQQVIKEKAGKRSVLFTEIPPISFSLNWLIIIAALDLLEISVPDIDAIPLEIPDHRLHFIGTIKGIDFYDDSKSTVPESTYAAVDKLSKRPIIVLIGGLSKGVNREPFIASLASRVKSAHFFGKEAHQLYGFAQRHRMRSESHQTLDDAFNAATRQACEGDQIVLSPAGTSYDLFKDYRERGKAFQHLVDIYQKNDQISIS